MSELGRLELLTQLSITGFLPAAKPAGQWMMIRGVLSLSAAEAFRGMRSMGTWVIEFTEFNSEVVSDLRGH